jgi:hypothetical protein
VATREGVTKKVVGVFPAPARNQVLPFPKTEVFQFVLPINK